MPKTSDYLDYILEDRFSHIPGIRHRAMFGGFGLYQYDMFFAIVIDDELYFKVGDGNRADYESAESEPFVYEGKNKPVTMSYWKVPEEVLEDPDEIRSWIEKAVDESRLSKKPKK